MEPNTETNFGDSAQSFSTISVTKSDERPHLTRTQHSLGYKPSTIVDKTPRHTLEYGDARLPDAHDLARFDQIAVRDQGDRSTCVGQALRTIREYLALTHGLSVRLSMEYIYDESKELEQDTNPGTRPDLALMILASKGTPHEDTIPDQSQDNLVPPAKLEAADTEAAYFRISGYGFLETEEILLGAIAEDTPVLIGIQLTEAQLREMEAPNFSGIIPTPNPGESFVGGHALAVYGYVLMGGTTYLKVRNSWGASWNKTGNALISIGYPQLFTDAWAVRL